MQRRHVSSGSPYEPIIGFRRAVRAGHHIAVGATAPIWPDGSCDPDPAAQARRCLAIVEVALVEAGAAMTDVVRTRTYLVAHEDWETVGRVHGAIFGDVRPVSRRTNDLAGVRGDGTPARIDTMTWCGDLSGPAPGLALVVPRPAALAGPMGPPCPPPPPRP